MSEQPAYDVIIIGGGPAGLNAALILGRSRRQVLVIDSGQPRNAAARQLHGYLGHDGIAPGDLLERGRQEIARYGVELWPDEATAAETLSAPGDKATRFRVTTKAGRTVTARKLLLATGVVDHLPRIDGLRECYGVSVHHCPYCDGWEHRGQRLAAIGGDTEKTVGLALALCTWSQEIFALTNGATLDSRQQQQLARKRIAPQTDAIRRLIHRSGQLQAVEFTGGGTLSADALFFNTGHKQHSDLAAQLAAGGQNEKHAQTTDRQQAPVPGVFVAGDADGDVQFVIVAAAEGATAAVAINRELQEEEA